MPSDEALTGIGELIFSLLIGYLGALECAFVVRHLYHCTFQHPAYTTTDAAADNDELPRLRERLEKDIAEAAEREARAGTKAMQDGVLYDTKGLRVDPAGEKREALAAELERQRRIEEETRRQLAEAEARLAEDRRRAKEADEQMIEQQREERKQREENERKLIEAEKQREAEQRQREEQEQKQREENERKLIEENERKLIEAEREREANERRIQAAEEQRERQENDERLLEAERRRELAEAEAETEQRDAEIVERLLAAERARQMSATESELEEEALEVESRRLLSGRVDPESKQKMIEENARLFLEAEEEMVMLQQRQLQAANSREEDSEYAGAVPVEEAPCLRKILPPRFREPEAQEQPMMVQKVKTQYGQSKGRLAFPGVSDEGSSLEPASSQQSSFSTQPSEDLLRTEEERPEPEGEDQTPPDVQYTEDYLRSLDGIKSRPLVREDGSGRRRAFKKRRSSGSSNSSRDSRASRDEELKMFTSLEEEELRHGDHEDYNPIKYSSEPTLRVKSHHRRHKRSPAKDMMPPSEAEGEASGVSLEMLGEESTNPWGEVVPEHYKDTEFWKREKALSIDEEDNDLELSKNEPKSSSFEDATEAQNEEAATTLLQQQKVGAKEQPDDTSPKAAETSASSDNKSNLRTSPATEEQSKGGGGSPGLRRSPRIDEMDHYAERWSATQPEHPEQPQTPSISVQQPDTAPWRDQYGLMMEGLSDFYDFQASVNPSRSPSSSRNPSPQPKNVANRMDAEMEKSLEVYDDTEHGLAAGELNCELVLQLLATTMNGNEESPGAPLAEQLKLQNVADDAGNGSAPVAMVYAPAEAATTENTLREERASSDPRRHSRSRSPLPTSENLERSISQRRQRLIKHNDEIMERLSNSSGSSGSGSGSGSGGRNSPMETEANGSVTPPLQLPQPVIEINDMAMDEPMEEEEQATLEERRLFVETLRAERNSRSRSRSRSRSPLPTADNIAKSLESRRQRRIQHNDEIFEKLHEQEEQEATAVAASLPIPCVSIEIEAPPEERQVEVEAVEEDTPDSMARLFEQLRLNRVRSHSRSRSRSRTPLPSAANLEHSLERRRDKLIAQNDMFFEQLQERANTPEPRLTVEYVYEFVQEEAAGAHASESRDMRSLSPSRSRSLTPPEQKGNDFHRMLNLEGSEQRTLRKNSEELESVLASSAKQRELDLEALQQLQHASEETELRVLSPTGSERQRVEQMTRGEPAVERTVSEVARELQDELVASGFKRSTYVGESLDQLEDKAAQRELQAAILDSLTENRLGAKPKTFAEELKDTQRMQDESLSSGFRRSTYVGEMSQDMSATQLDDLRHRTAEFQRSRSQSRSPLRGEEVALLRDIDEEVAKRELQDQLLDKLAASSVNFENFSRHLNADFLDSERRASDSAILKQSDPYGEHLEPEEYHHFRRYSLAQEQPVEDYPSDEYVYISQIEVRTMTGTRTWLKEDYYSQERDEYECSKESVVDQDSWARAVLAAEAEAAAFDATNAIYSYDIAGEQQQQQQQQEQDFDFDLDLDLERSSTNDSDDERQTVVEIDDEDEFEYEFDEGISDNNERTQPTDESHHDTSECEEAERNVDRYANRGAQDWEEVDDADDFLDYGVDDGAVGGATPYSDPDSFIEQIYNDAIKNRKQSGILREYETIVQEQLPSDHSESSDKEKSSSESERYALWAKTRELERSSSRNRNTDVDIALGLGLGLGLVESERRDTEMRYLGDAQVAARQSTRLRTRYGYNPQLQAGVELEDDIEVDLNYKPKREYNWRKNFRLDEAGNEDGNEGGDMRQRTEEDEEEEEQEERDRYEEEQQMDLEDYNRNEEPLQYQENEQTNGEMSDLRRMSLGGESITLFSRSPMRELLTDVPEESTLPAEGEAAAAEAAPNEELPPPMEASEPPSEKPKKKKSKKKVRKGSKTEEELREDNDSDTQMYASRRQEDQQEAAAAELTPKRKSRSRRNSKSSLTNEDAGGGGGGGGALFSPRSSLAFVGESLEGIAEFEAPETRLDEDQPKKKTKKRKKAKETREEAPLQAPEMDQMDEALVAALAEIAPVSVSSNLTPESTQQNLLSSVSAGQSVCVTPASSIEEATPSTTSASASAAAAAAASVAVVPARSVVDTFDILKDANFYPLF
ncbi:LOW QUALITY PROTEIN: trichohyalin-like [Drosophila obscura]|uniref:LOW QUALITY PROTEIN: trichohyalin-like n=1 Tax=Drosophila obscura TaxID=7282 RepID=UPI001BB183B9|nr:LOW QUALITY PROTEIN: trichohyalin-like [Drosophila obscura]